jgi:diguanylate cyclase (GGDEF)-like protein
LITPLKSLRYGEQAVVWVARNITERYKLEKQLTYQSEIDSLSNLFNRRKLFECLNNAFYSFQRYKENSSFLLLDIDNFKQINDSYGHQSGDDVIRKIAEICRSALRHTDVIGRLGGDEFGIIHKITEKNSSLALAKRLNKVVAAFSCDENTMDSTISISIGISQFTEQDHCCELIYHRADMALYKSKRAGKNQFSES